MKTVKINNEESSRPIYFKIEVLGEDHILDFKGSIFVLALALASAAKQNDSVDDMLTLANTLKTLKL